METVKTAFVTSILAGVLYAAGQVVAAEGWKAGGVFLLIVIAFLSLVAGVADVLTAPFRNRRNG